MVHLCLHMEFRGALYNELHSGGGKVFPPPRHDRVEVELRVPPIKIGGLTFRVLEKMALNVVSEKLHAASVYI